MTRLMGDATHAQVPILATVPGLQLVAGYVTGSPDIVWTAADWARFPGIPHVTIDQAFTGSPVPTAMVRDVESGAWSPADAVVLAGWTAPRPTIYCGRFDLSRPGGVLASGWQGDLWLAIPGWQPGQALPAAPGCTIVAVQNDYSNPAYDLSLVLDPTWPDLPGDEMKILTIDRNTVPAGVNWPGSVLLRPDGTVKHLLPAEYAALLHAGITEVPNYPYLDWAALAGVL